MHKWTLRHTSLCVKLALSSSARLLWEWLVSYAKENVYKEVEFNLTEFNQWIARRRKNPYDPRTLKRAAAELVEKEVVTDLAPDRFKWNWHRWQLRDVFVKKASDKPRLKRSQNADLVASKPHSVAKEDLTTTTNSTLKDETVAQIEELVQCEEAMSALEESVDACKEAGISFTPEAAIQVLSWHTVEEVKAAIAYTLKRAQSNPAGYLRVVLENEYWKRPSSAATLTEVFKLLADVVHKAQEKTV